MMIICEVLIKLLKLSIIDEGYVINFYSLQNKITRINI